MPFSIYTCSFEIRFCNPKIHIMKKLLYGILMLLAAACNTPSNQETEPTILGEWDIHDTYEGKPWTLLARFKPDGTVNAMANGKLVISQKFVVSGDTIYFSGDPNCAPNSVGAYKLTYFGDSLKINLIDDTCSVRIMNTDKVRFGRVKK